MKDLGELRMEVESLRRATAMAIAVVYVETNFFWAKCFVRLIWFFWTLASDGVASWWVGGFGGDVEYHNVGPTERSKYEPFRSWHLFHEPLQIF